MHNVQACITRMSAGRKTAMLHTYDLMSRWLFLFRLCFFPESQHSDPPVNWARHSTREWIKSCSSWIKLSREILRWFEVKCWSSSDQRATSSRQLRGKSCRKNFTHLERWVKRALMKADRKVATTSKKYLHVCITNRPWVHQRFLSARNTEKVSN